ncbi:MAG: tRNA (N(6)-L-threonylcarbamoyladenosine(37)-C(2))-methylthiotransferase MtaB [Lachnospiraceae bacterium]|nr:tRNA (N(6)-L-threonylcarbamoyladenosine(37)-C(2))-methylthiotransferase MtaB [Lachnospiraceae bacterium]
MSCRVAFMTLGCKVNQYETEKLQEQFETAGYLIVPYEEEADIYIVNTCTVTNIADRKSRKMLRRGARHIGAMVVAMGCFADAAGEKLLSDKDIDVVIGNEKKENAFAIIEEAYNQKTISSTLICAANAADIDNTTNNAETCLSQERTRTYINIQTGCNQFCSYCKIPYVRGKLKSRDAKDVVCEARLLAGKGYKEIVLTGIHLSSYGVDKSECKHFTELNGEPLYELVREISEIEGIERIRLGSLEPRIMTEGFVSKLSSEKKVCPHFHLSLQSGCDETLGRMNRKYTTAEYKNACDILRKYYDNPAITTDIIVGFPGETEEEFETTLSYVKEIGFSAVHVFKYSIRTGTKAALMSGHIPEQIKTERSHKLIELCDSLSKEYMEHFLGEEILCLVEECVDIDGEMYWVGHNERYVKLGFKYREGDDFHNKIIQIIPCAIENNILIYNR